MSSRLTEYEKPKAHIITWKACLGLAGPIAVARIAMMDVQLGMTKMRTVILLGMVFLLFSACVIFGSSTRVGPITLEVIDSETGIPVSGITVYHVAKKGLFQSGEVKLLLSRLKN